MPGFAVLFLLLVSGIIDLEALTAEIEPQQGAGRKVNEGNCYAVASPPRTPKATPTQQSEHDTDDEGNDVDAFEMSVENDTPLSGIGECAERKGDVEADGSDSEPVALTAHELEAQNVTDAAQATEMVADSLGIGRSTSPSLLLTSLQPPRPSPMSMDDAFYGSWLRVSPGLVPEEIRSVLGGIKDDLDNLLQALPPEHVRKTRSCSRSIDDLKMQLMRSHARTLCTALETGSTLLPRGAPFPTLPTECLLDIRAVLLHPLALHTATDGNPMAWQYSFREFPYERVIAMLIAATTNTTGEDASYCEWIAATAESVRKLHDAAKLYDAQLAAWEHNAYLAERHNAMSELPGSALVSSWACVGIRVHCCSFSRGCQRAVPPHVELSDATLPVASQRKRNT